MTGGGYAALAYGAVFVVVLGYVAIIAAKLQRLQRDAAELAALVRRADTTSEPRRTAVYAAPVPGSDDEEST